MQPKAPRYELAETNGLESDPDGGEAARPAGFPQQSILAIPAAPTGSSAVHARARKWPAGLHALSGRLEEPSWGCALGIGLGTPWAHPNLVR
jgi:hypothetical protein